jgi:hypothetical protein
VPDNDTEGGTHASIVRSINIADIKVGDVVKTRTGDLVKVKETSQDDNSILVQNTEGVAVQKVIGIEEVIEIVKTGYVLVDAIKFLVSIFKKMFQKG